MEAEAALSYDIVWSTFSLEQVNLPPEEDVDAMWATPGERRGLLPLAAAKWAEMQGPDALGRVMSAFLDARHTDRKPIGKPEVVKEVLTAGGFDGSKIVEELLSNRHWLDAARADHEEAVDLGIFGVPTLVFPESRPVYLKLLEVPEGARAVDAFRRIEAMALDPLVQEFKRPSIGRR